MKKFIKVLALFTLTTSQSQAFLVFTLAVNPHVRLEDVGYVVDDMGILIAPCIVLLPVCLLDQKSSNTTKTGSIDPEFLFENGYDQDQVNQIVSDQKLLVAALSKHQVQIKIDRSDSAATIREGIEALVPGVSDLYIQFLHDFGL